MNELNLFPTYEEFIGEAKNEKECEYIRWSVIRKHTTHEVNGIRITFQKNLSLRSAVEDCKDLFHPKLFDIHKSFGYEPTKLGKEMGLNLITSKYGMEMYKPEKAEMFLKFWIDEGYKIGYFEDFTFDDDEEKTNEFIKKYKLEKYCKTMIKR